MVDDNFFKPLETFKVKISSEVKKETIVGIYFSFLWGIIRGDNNSKKDHKSNRLRTNNRLKLKLSNNRCDLKSQSRSNPECKRSPPHISRSWQRQKERNGLECQYHYFSGKNYKDGRSYETS